MELRPCSDAQGDVVSELTFSSWGAPHVTFPQYLDREEHFRATQFGAWIADYVFVPAAEPESTDIRGYLEIFQRRAALRPHDGSAPLTFDAYSVAFVVTPEGHRRQGHASAMLSAFLEAMSAMKDAVSGAPLPYLVSNLYSDVGAKLYAASGWDLVESTEIVLPSTLAATPTVAAMDRAAMLAELAPGQVAFLLSADCFEFYHVKHRYCGTHRHGMATLPTKYGAIVSNGDETLGYALWTYNFEEGTLDVLKYRALSQNFDVFGALLPTLLAEATAWGLGSVCLWPTKQMARHPIIAAHTHARKDSLSMLLVRGNSPEASDQPFEWVGDELYLYA
ncbi:hypothetical protein ACHHYP_17117 [Achlya hypogyna]|uniref:LYC1 C-terminal domain-containing protein n=1 Tax=Achlya hypogyna TaxID=1202772 RepID=A0A1V9Y563_ACHHY|nr:hypothetical protein ACHHYP_17117 [Achlya hypogyna]